MTDPKPLRAIVCDLDPVHRLVVSQLVEEAGFEVVGEATNAIETIQQNQYLHPTLIVISHDQIGLSGLDAIADLRSVDDPPEVILLSVDDAAREHAHQAGAFELSIKGDNDMLARLLSEARELLETGERRKSRDRRDTPDRREHQDWSKVTTERRSGADRRGNLRREKDVTTTARDIVAKRRPKPPA